MVLGLLTALLASALVFRSWLGAQWEAVVVLSTTNHTAVVTWTVERLTDEPRAAEVEVAGQAATLVRPGEGGPWPALVFVNGATELGHLHPKVQALARGLARAGYLVLVPELPGLRDGEITTRTLDATIAIAEAAASRPDVRRGRVGLVGVSVGAGLALAAAEDPSIARRISLVAGIAPYADLAGVVRLATTGYYRENGRLVRYEGDRFISLVAARSLIAALPIGPGRTRLLAELGTTAENPPNPLGPLRTTPSGILGHRARAVVRLLANGDPRRFDALYAALPASIRAGVRRLSPLSEPSNLEAPVELATAPHDKYFPPEESEDLAAAAPDVDVTITRTLAHAIPEPSLRDIRDLFRFDAFVVRALHTASADA